MQSCWETKPSQRPSFTELKTRIESLLQQTKTIDISKSDNVDYVAIKIFDEN
jgi:hypothetical protein